MKLVRQCSVTCLAVVAFGGCASVTPIGPGYVYEPDAREQRNWKASKKASASHRMGGARYHDEELQLYVQSVLERVLGNNLSAYVPLEPRVFILDSPVVNAFALPNGHFFVHTGLLGRIRNEAQLAMLLGHEITHATHRHSDQRISDATARTDILAYISVISVLGGSNIQNAMTGVSSLITQAAISGYSRAKEAEADRIGLTLIAQAGYSPVEGAELFERMLQATGKKRQRWNAFYASHPKMKNRVQSCNRLLEHLHPEVVARATEVGRDRYLAHTAPLIIDEAKRHITQGKFDLAFATIGFMQKARPVDPVAHVLLGDLYRAKMGEGYRDMAEEAYRDARAIDENCAEAYRGLGLLYVKSGRMADAKRQLSRYLALRPHAVDAPFVRQYIEKLNGD